ncbi:IclR family transcriptional regulator [Cupriavidus basilensis]
MLDGPDVLYAERIQAGLTRLGVDIRIGSRVPAYSTAVGYAILAWLPEDMQARVLDAQPRQKLTDHTLTDLGTILERLKAVRAKGYALSDQETVSGLYVVAAPVLDVDGVPVAGLSVAAPAMNTSLEDFESTTAPAVVHAATELARALQPSGGFIPPTLTTTVLRR